MTRTIGAAILGLTLLLSTACNRGPDKNQVAVAVLRAFPTTRAKAGFQVEDSVRLENGDYVVKVSYDTEGGAGPLGDPPGHYTFRFTMTKVGGEWKIIRSEMLGMDVAR